MVIAVAPVVEEFFFRGFFYRALRNRLSMRSRRWWSASLFGLIHYSSTGSTGCRSCRRWPCSGSCSASSTRSTGSLLAPIGMHAFNNAIAFGVQADDGWTVSVAVAPAGARGRSSSRAAGSRGHRSRHRPASVQLLAHEAPSHSPPHRRRRSWAFPPRLRPRWPPPPRPRLRRRRSRPPRGKVTLKVSGRPADEEAPLRGHRRACRVRGTVRPLVTGQVVWLEVLRSGKVVSRQTAARRAPAAASAPASRPAARGGSSSASVTRPAAAARLPLPLGARQGHVTQRRPGLARHEGVAAPARALAARLRGCRDRLLRRRHRARRARLPQDQRPRPRRLCHTLRLTPLCCGARARFRPRSRRPAATSSSTGRARCSRCSTDGPRRQRLPRVLGQAVDADRLRPFRFYRKDPGTNAKGMVQPTTSSAATRSTATPGCRTTRPATAASGCRSRTRTRSATRCPSASRSSCTADALRGCLRRPRSTRLLCAHIVPCVLGSHPCSQRQERGGTGATPQAADDRPPGAAGRSASAGGLAPVPRLVAALGEQVRQQQAAEAEQEQAEHGGHQALDPDVVRPARLVNGLTRTSFPSSTTRGRRSAGSRAGARPRRAGGFVQLALRGPAPHGALSTRRTCALRLLLDWSTANSMRLRATTAAAVTAADE